MRGDERADWKTVNTDVPTDRPTTLPQYVAILKRQKWILIALPLVAGLVAYVASSTQSSLYSAKAEVYINQSNLAATLVGVSVFAGDPTRLMTNQAMLARNGAIADRVASTAGVPGVSAGTFLDNSSASAEPDADFLNLSASAGNPSDAIALVNAYARQFISFRREQDTAKVNAALERTEKSIDRMRQQGRTDSSAYDDAITTRDRLKTFGDAAVNNAQLQSEASSAAKVRPRPKRDALIGVLLGLLVATAIAFLAEALDKRVRSEQEVEDALGLPLLARLPRPSRALRQRDALLMLEDPRSIHAETIRKLRTSVEFVNADRGAKSIMITSAGPREGKSTTIGNLAVALARAGRKVALVDLDLRRPYLHTFFGVERGYGITDVVVGRIALEAAARKIALPAAPLHAAQRVNDPRHSVNGANGKAATDAMMLLVPAGTTPPAADEFLESERLDDVLDRLQAECDLVLIDAPPLLAVGDVLTLSTKVDGMIVAVRLGIHRRQLAELARQLHNCRADILGHVLTGVGHGDSYGYGYGYDPHVYEAQSEEQPRETV